MGCIINAVRSMRFYSYYNFFIYFFITIFARARALIPRQTRPRSKARRWKIFYINF